jgi:hypothetical protein
LSIDGRLAYEVLKDKNRGLAFVKYFADLTSNNYFDITLQQCMTQLLNP